METKEIFSYWFENESGNYELFDSDTRILLSILPINIWAHTSKKLGKKDAYGLENLSNSSLFFRNLNLSRRVVFLFARVINLVGPELASRKNTRTQGSDVTRSRIICKEWNLAVDKFIMDGSLEPDFLKDQSPLPSDHALVDARYQYFGQMLPTRLPEFLAHFEQTHSSHPSRNPFIGQIVHIDLSGFRDIPEIAATVYQVSILLRKYGHHIKILNLTLFTFYHNPNFERLQQWILEWLRKCPNLTHLKVSQKFTRDGEQDLAFGELPDLRRRMRTNADVQFRPLNNYHRFNIPCVDADTDTPNPTSAVKKLQALKLIRLSALNFNFLISANTHVISLHVEPLRMEKDRYIDYYALEFPNLKKLYIKRCSPAEVWELRNVHKSWLRLTHLHFEYCTPILCCLLNEFTPWIEIFWVLALNWGNTLTDLKLRLPMASSEGEKERIVKNSIESRLCLPSLRRLKIYLSERPGETRVVAKTDFLNLLRLEELIIE